MSNQRTVTGILLTTLAVLFCGSASADFIDDHLRVRTFISAGPGALLDNLIDGSGTVDTEEQELISGVYIGTGRARAEQNGAVLRSRSSSATQGTGNSDFVTSRMSVAYRDVLEVTGSGAPPVVRFNFSVHATLAPSLTATGGVLPAVSTSALVVSAFPGIINFPSVPFPPNGTHATVESVGGSTVATTTGAGWDTTSFTAIDATSFEFHGTFSLLSNLLTGPKVGDGVYFVSAAFDTLAINRRSSASTNAYDTMRLQSITLPDGSPLPSGPNLSYQFESGAPIEPDDDLDGIANNSDNCLLVANVDQSDTNADNLGNICDADISGPGGFEDCEINFLDLTALVDAFLSAPGSPNWNPDADFDTNLTVNFVDFSIMANAFFGAPGPSGLPNDCSD